MGVFWILLLVPLWIQHIASKRVYIEYEKRNKAALGVFFFILTALVMLRHESVGNDTSNYIMFFKRFYWTPWQYLGRQGLEIGFAWLNKLVSLISSTPQFFLAVSALLVSAMMYPTYKRLCVDASLTIVLFCTMSTFVMMFSGIRQMLAIGVGLLCYEFTRTKRLIPFALAALLAVSFHASAFMLVFMYPLYNAKITKKWLYVVIPALVLVFVFNRQIFSFLLIILARQSWFEGGLSSTGAYAMIVLFAAFAVFAFLIPDEKRLDEEVIGLRNFLLLSLVIQLFAPLHELAMRMSYYYIIFIPLLIPKIIACRSEQWKQVAIWARHIMVVFFFAYFMFVAYSGGALHVFPYHFFWENV